MLALSVCVCNSTQTDGLEVLCYGENHKTKSKPDSNTLEYKHTIDQMSLTRNKKKKDGSVSKD